MCSAGSSSSSSVMIISSLLSDEGLCVFSRLQVTEETDPSVDDLSDCSSDSMEVCCEDLGENHTTPTSGAGPPTINIH